MENEDKRMAWFPAPYLEKLDEEEDEDDINGTLERGTCLDSFLKINSLLQLAAVSRDIMTSCIKSIFFHSQECCTLQSRTTRPPKMMR